MAGFLLFRGCDNAAATGRERPGLDTGSPSQVTAPLLKVFRLIHPTSCLSLLINTAVSFTIYGAGRRHPKITQRLVRLFVCFFIEILIVITFQPL